MNHSKWLSHNTFAFISRCFNFFYKEKVNPTMYVKKQFIKEAGSVLHIGAHIGQEREFYNSLEASVLWIEGDPSIYSVLLRNLQNFPKQSAYCALLGEESISESNFYVTNNSGMSSSIFNLSATKIFPNLEIVETKTLPLVKLEDILKKSEKVYPYWVVDVQGAELLVLKGSGSFLNECNYLEIEVSTYEVYHNQPLFPELEAWLDLQGFYPIWKPQDGFHDNVLFIRR